MKTILSILILLCITPFTFGQKKDFKLSNAVVVSHLDKQEDRFSLEITISEVLSNLGIKNTVSLNLLKQGGDPQVLLTDSMSQSLQQKGFTTLMLVSVRGYDKKFKPSSNNVNIAEDLAAENLFPLYKEDIVSVTLEFHFYEAGVLVKTDLLKISGISTREAVIKKLRKKLTKKATKSWK